MCGRGEHACTSSLLFSASDSPWPAEKIFREYREEYIDTSLFIHFDFRTLKFSQPLRRVSWWRKVQWDGDTIVMIIVRCTADRKRESGDQRPASINRAKRLIQRSYVRMKKKMKKKVEQFLSKLVRQKRDVSSSLSIIFFSFTIIR